MYKEEKQLLEKYLPTLLSYLKATTRTDLTNHIYTVGNKEVTLPNGRTLPKRSPSNGLAQFHLYVMEDISATSYIPRSYYVRVENNVFFDNKLSLVATRIENLRKSDLLVFGDEKSFYVSKADRYGVHDWLDSKDYREIMKVTGRFGDYTCYKYDVNRLLANKKIVGLSYDEANNKVVSYTGSIFIDNGSNVERAEYPYNDYKRECADLSPLWVQHDIRQAAIVYYCFYGQRYTSSHATVPEIASQICKWCGIDNEAAVRQKLYRMKKQTNESGKAHAAKFAVADAEKLRNDLAFDSSLLTENDEIVVYLSYDKNFDVFKNAKTLKTADMKEYQKNYDKKEYYKHYRKVSQWFKKNPNRADFPTKWDDYDLKIAKSILLKE